MLKPRFLTLIGVMLAAALVRVLPHPWNFTPLGAMALFGGAKFGEKWMALLFPLSALFLSDLVLGFYPGMWTVYVAFTVVVGIGMLVKKHPSVLAIGGGTLTSSIVFFLITNFGWWFPDQLYPTTAAGLLQSYAAGIPFFRNTLLGDAFYVVVLFGGFALAEKFFPALTETPEPALLPAA